MTLKTLYLECAMGAAGDMLTAALLELLPDQEGFLRQMNEAGIPGAVMEALPAQRCGIGGTRVSVRIHGQEEGCEHHHDHDHGHEHHHHEHLHDHDHSHPHEHAHAAYGSICQLIDGLRLPEEVRMDAKAVYRLIAEAEAQVHGRPVEEVHFHEVGALDAVADVTACCLLLHLLKPERIVVSPVRVGGGMVKCAHGLLPVPAPATALLLEGIPSAGGPVDCELCTPTGAALLKYFGGEFGSQPLMQVEKIGCGMGARELSAANCLRAFWGESAGEDGFTNQVTELSCNLDDMTGEAIGYAMELLLEKGALDVFTTPIGMKKGRPAVMLTCLCAPERSREFGELLLTHTTTIGVRRRLCSRMVLRSCWVETETDYGPLRVKISEGYGVTRCKPEFDDVRRIAQGAGLPLKEVEARAAAAVAPVAK